MAMRRERNSIANVDFARVWNIFHERANDCYYLLSILFARDWIYTIFLFFSLQFSFDEYRRVEVNDTLNEKRVQFLEKKSELSSRRGKEKKRRLVRRGMNYSAIFSIFFSYDWLTRRTRNKLVQFLKKSSRRTDGIRIIFAGGKKRERKNRLG